MTTQEATRKLAEIYLYGATGNASEHRLGVYLARARAYGRAWNWVQVAAQLAGAYRALGAKPEGSAYEWHIGVHPIQMAVRQIEAEKDSHEHQMAAAGVRDWELCPCGEMRRKTKRGFYEYPSVDQYHRILGEVS